MAVAFLLFAITYMFVFVSIGLRGENGARIATLDSQMVRA